MNSIFKSVGNLASKATLGLSDSLFTSGGGKTGLFAELNTDWVDIGKAAIGAISSELAYSPSKPESSTKYGKDSSTMQGDEPTIFIQKPANSVDSSSQKAAKSGKTNNKNGLLNEPQRSYAAAIEYMSFFGKQSAF